MNEETDRCEETEEEEETVDVELEVIKHKEKGKDIEEMLAKSFNEQKVVQAEKFVKSQIKYETSKDCLKSIKQLDMKIKNCSKKLLTLFFNEKMF